MNQKLVLQKKIIEFILSQFFLLLFYIFSLLFYSLHTIHHHHPPPSMADCCRQPPAATDYHRRPPLIATDDHTIHHCLPVFAIVVHPILYHLPSLATIVFHCTPCLSTTATTARCRQQPLPFTTCYYHPSSSTATATTIVHYIGFLMTQEE